MGFNSGFKGLKYFFSRWLPVLIQVHKKRGHGNEAAVVVSLATRSSIIGLS